MLEAIIQTFIEEVLCKTNTTATVIKSPNFKTSTSNMHLLEWI